MADAKAETPETSQDLTIFVQNLLEQMVLQFSSPSFPYSISAKSL
jgi:hypothetical protein